MYKRQKLGSVLFGGEGGKRLATAERASTERKMRQESRWSLSSLLQLTQLLVFVICINYRQNILQTTSFYNLQSLWSVMNSSATHWTVAIAVFPTEDTGVYSGSMNCLLSAVTWQGRSLAFESNIRNPEFTLQSWWDRVHVYCAPLKKTKTQARLSWTASLRQPVLMGNSMEAELWGQSISTCLFSGSHKEPTHTLLDVEFLISVAFVGFILYAYNNKTCKQKKNITSKITLPHNVQHESSKSNCTLSRFFFREKKKKPEGPPPPIQCKEKW